MANRFSKTHVTTSVSDNSDGTEPNCRSTIPSETNTVTMVLNHTVKCVTGGTSVGLAGIGFTTLNEVILHNTDSTNFVTLTFTTLVGNISAGTMKILAGQTVVLTDVDPNNTFSIAGDSATVACELFVYGD